MSLPNDLTTRFDAELWICPVQYGIVCKGGGASAPPPVDPVALAKAQTDSNIATAQTQSKLNNVNTYSPLGSSTFWYNPETGQYNLNQNLTPWTGKVFGAQVDTIPNLLEQGRLFTQNGVNASNAAGNATNYINPAFNSGAGPIQRNVPTDFPAQVQAAQDAAYRSQTQYLDPQFSQARSNLAQQLADQGIGINNAAYDRATGNLARQQQQAYQGAQNAAVTAGNEEQARLFAEGLGAGQFSNQAQQQGFGQDLTRWQAPINAATALSGIGAQNFGTGLSSLSAPSTLGWAGQLPTFGGSPTAIAPSNVVGAQQVASQAAQNQFAAQNTLNNQLFNGLGSLGSVLGGANGLFGASGLFGGGGLLSGLFSGGGGAASGLGSVLDVATLFA